MPAERSEDDAGGPTIACVEVTKSFGHVDALRGATLTVRKGKVTVLFGDNGAGKSTLLRVLCGIYTPDSGEVLIEGQPVKLRSIRDAHSRGIDVIHQDLALAPDLTVTENVYLGHEELFGGWRSAFGVLARRRMGCRPRPRCETSASIFPRCSYRWSSSRAGNAKPSLSPEQSCGAGSRF